MSTVENTETRRFRNPLNPPILYLAHRFGGSKAKELERFLKFVVVGVSGALIDLGTLIILQSTVLPPENRFNVGLATTIAFVLAVLSNFTWTRLWVYPDSRSRSVRRQLTMFFTISIIGWSARTLWITTTHKAIGYLLLPAVLPIVEAFRPEYAPSPLAEERLGSVVAQLIAMGFVMLWNFFANRYWTYNDVE